MDLCIQCGGKCAEAYTCALAVKPITQHGVTP